MKAVVQAGEYVDRSLATASWWDRHELVAGEYPVWWTTITGRDVHPGHTDVYYGLVAVETRLVECYRENRLLGAVRSQTEQPGTRAVVSFRPYRYEVQPGVTLAGGLVTIVDGDVRPYGDDNRCRGCGHHICDTCASDCARMWLNRRVRPERDRP